MSFAPIIVLQALDVVFAEVGAVLYLYEHQHVFARVRDAVRGAGRHIQGIAGLQGDDVFVAGGGAGPGNDEPVLRPMTVTLEAESRSGQHLDTLDLVGVGIFEDLVAAPRAGVVLESGMLGLLDARGGAVSWMMV